ncbi:MAG: hypothetical protein ACRCUT_04750, partial [Spirochaetota bacterium]
ARTAGVSVPVLYTGTNGPVDLEAGRAATVSILLSQQGMSMNAEISLRLLDSGGSSFTPPAGHTLLAKVYLPVAAGGEINIGEETVISSITSSSAQLTAYPNTYQFVLALSLSSDGNATYLGGVIASRLESGSNAVDITMMLPSLITVSSGLNEGEYVEAEMDVDGTVYSLYEGYWTAGTTLRCPSGVHTYSADAPSPRTVEFTVGSTVYPVTINPLKWGKNSITISR